MTSDKLTRLLWSARLRTTRRSFEGALERVDEVSDLMDVLFVTLRERQQQELLRNVHTHLAKAAFAMWHENGRVATGALDQALAVIDNQL